MNSGNGCSFEDTPFMERSCGRLASFMMMLQATMMTRCDIADPCRRAGKDEIVEGEWFDFIIVGAGVAGPVIARRLADHEPWWRVLLIEAGPEEPTMTSLPGFAFNAIGTHLDWNYETEPTQPNPTACLENGGRCKWPRGKMVSGTGGLYGMMYARGHPEIYNKWSRSGNKGWSYSEIEHYFEHAENPEKPDMTSDRKFARVENGGPLKIKYFNHKPEFAEELLSAARELGYRTSNLVGNNQTGFMVAPMITENGQRGTTSRFYLRPVMHKSNIKVLTNTRVTRLLTGQWERRIRSVEVVDKNGNVRIIKADKEVILAAGAIGSPQILLNSGIGPAKDSTRLGIKCVADLPVGKNLHNHVSVGIKMSIRDTHYEAIGQNSMTEYLANRTGPLASTGLTQVTAFLQSSYATAGVPDIQVFFDGFGSKCTIGGHSNECPGGTIGNCPARREIVARPTTVMAKSRGVLKLRSKNPLDSPLIYPNYFEEREDMNILIEGIKKVADLTKTPTMKKWDLRLEGIPIPACSTYRFGTDAYWECLIRQQTGPENHQSGSCKMGPEGDESAVVDPELRVHGLRNVRVADASVFPIVPNANPVAAIVMVAEKASDMIIKTWLNLR
ncbi:glucose dehydrogenase [FAD, quinone]-like isoform X2 [Venturia canescens]|nr:glucose dehydrogenase [FAD, quinone]-like isoform X2 [Venturia canescens]